eukprot:5530026-Pyramimonas_sp.AAC.1
MIDPVHRATVALQLGLKSASSAASSASQAALRSDLGSLEARAEADWRGGRGRQRRAPRVHLRTSNASWTGPTRGFPRGFRPSNSALDLGGGRRRCVGRTRRCAAQDGPGSISLT